MLGFGLAEAAEFGLILAERQARQTLSEIEGPVKSVTQCALRGEAEGRNLTARYRPSEGGVELGSDARMIDCKIPGLSAAGDCQSDLARDAYIGRKIEPTVGLAAFESEAVVERRLL